MSFSILAGNTNNAFSIDASSGAIEVNNSSALDYAIQTSFAKVQVADPQGLSSSETITINILKSNIVFDADTGVISIFGGFAADFGVVTSASPTMTTVTLNGQSKSYVTADVTSVIFLGYGGNDVYRNEN